VPVCVRLCECVCVCASVYVPVWLKATDINRSLLSKFLPALKLANIPFLLRSSLHIKNGQREVRMFIGRLVMGVKVMEATSDTISFLHAAFEK